MWLPGKIWIEKPRDTTLNLSTLLFDIQRLSQQALNLTLRLYVLYATTVQNKDQDTWLYSKDGLPEIESGKFRIKWGFWSIL